VIIGVADRLLGALSFLDVDLFHRFAGAVKTASSGTISASTPQVPLKHLPCPVRSNRSVADRYPRALGKTTERSHRIFRKVDLAKHLCIGRAQFIQNTGKAWTDIRPTLL
jgi:hypothetical protein